MISQRQLFLNNVAQTSDSPLMLEVQKGKGVYLFDKDDKPYIDLIAGISVSNVGHCHPKVVEAVQQQATTYMHTMVYGEYVLSPQVELANFLTKRLPAHLNNVYIVNSGTEATEGAMKLAKRYTGRSEIIACKNAYHGSSQGALSILGDNYFKQGFLPLIPDTRSVEFNNFADIELITERTAAVFMEVVQAEAGIILPAEGYLKAIRDRCNQTGTLLVFDEIQTGCGRTGSLFAFNNEAINSSVEPDVLLLAKGLGGGMPIGAFIANQQLMEVFKDNPFLGHITTFGGHPVSCAAALACLQVIEEERLVESVATKSKLFMELLQHERIEKIYAAGLMMAVYLKDFETVQQVIRYCLEHGVISDWFLFASNCIRIAPPLVIEEAEIRKACSVILAALDTI